MVDSKGAVPPPPFTRNLPSNVSKTQGLRPKIRESSSISGEGVPLFGALPSFSECLDPPLQIKHNILTFLKIRLDFPHLALIDWLNKSLQHTLQSGENIYVKIYNIQ